MFTKLRIIPFVILIIHFSCTDLFIGDDPENTPENNFDILWRDFDQYYAFFDHKNINWDSLYTVYRPKINKNTSDQELLDIFSNLLAPLKDGHISVKTPIGNYIYSDWWKYYANIFQLDIIKDKYLSGSYKTVKEKNFTYGKVTEKIGYIYIKSFSSKLKESDYEVIDEIIREFNDCQALILDIRNNGGGAVDYADIIANRFTASKRLIAYFRFRNGRKHHDFTDYIPKFIEPEGEKRFYKPVVLLVNRKTFSAAEYFALAMKSLPNVTLLGVTTGGGSGSPISRELLNGWIYSLSRGFLLKPDFTYFEEIGIQPDIFLQNTATDELFQKDSQLVAAINYLQELIN